MLSCVCWLFTLTLIIPAACTSHSESNELLKHTSTSWGSTRSSDASVLVQTQKRLLSDFIDWAEGLETREGLDWGKRRVVFVSVANLPSELDPAVLDG